MFIMFVPYFYCTNTVIQGLDIFFSSWCISSLLMYFHPFVKQWIVTARQGRPVFPEVLNSWVILLDHLACSANWNGRYTWRGSRYSSVRRTLLPGCTGNSKHNYWCCHMNFPMLFLWLFFNFPCDQKSGSGCWW